MARDLGEAAVWLRRAVEAGSLAARTELGLALLAGAGVPRDPLAALGLLEPGAEAGDLRAAAALGRLHAEGAEGLPADPVRAARLLEAPARAGDAEALLALGRLRRDGALSGGVPLPADRGEAARLFRAAAERGSAAADLEFARLILDDPQSAQEARPFLDRAAERGEVEADWLLGSLMGPHETQRRLIHWGRAAGRGHARAQLALGRLLLEEVGGDAERGLGWLELAAGQGLVEAALLLADVWQEGRLVPADPVRALRWLRQAAEAGHAGAQGRLARLLLSDDPDLADPAAATGWLRRAAEQGDQTSTLTLIELMAARGAATEAVLWALRLAEATDAAGARAAWFLGTAWRDGQGVEPSPAHAIAWFARAGEGGLAAAWRAEALLLPLGSERRRALIEAAAAAGDPGAQAERGRRLLAAGETAEGERLLAAAARAGEIEAALELGRRALDPADWRPAEALAWLGQAAEAGDGQAAVLLARQLLTGRGIVRDPARARRLLQMAAHKGSAEAMVLLAEHLEHGRRDGLAARRWTERAAALLHPRAMIRLGSALAAEGRGEEGRRWLARAAQRGDAASALALARALMEANPPDPAGALPWLRRAAERGLAEAQYLYGQCLESGRGIAADPLAARRWYARAAEGGAAAAAARLGMLLLDEPGRAAEAAPWLTLAAEAGIAAAQGQLGFLHRDGVGVERSLERALTWWRRAATAGHAPSQAALGIAWRDGVGVPVNARNAARLLRQAAEQEHPQAMAALGELYRAGAGVGQDPILAARWLARAAAADFDPARRALDQLMLAAVIRRLEAEVGLGAVIAQLKAFPDQPPPEGAPQGDALPVSLNLVLEAWPGCGRGTVAAAWTAALHELGLVAEPAPIELPAAAPDLTRRLARVADRPGTLAVLLSEAERLADPQGLAAALLHHRGRMVVIAAGAPPLPAEEAAGPEGVGVRARLGGAWELARRLPRHLTLGSYGPLDLARIFERRAEAAGWILDRGAWTRLNALTADLAVTGPRVFGNARAIAARLARAIAAHERRPDALPGVLTDADLEA